MGGDHRARAQCAGRPPRGTAPLRPRHGDVPRLSAPVGRSRLPAGRRGTARLRRRARCRGHGHQGRRRPTLGRPATPPPPPGTSRRPSADDVARGVRFALSTPGVHAFCTPGDTGVLTTALAAAAEATPRWARRTGPGDGRHGRRGVHLPDGPRPEPGGGRGPRTRTVGARRARRCVWPRPCRGRWCCCRCPSGARCRPAPSWWCSSR